MKATEIAAQLVSVITGALTQAPGMGQAWAELSAAERVALTKDAQQAALSVLLHAVAVELAKGKL